MQILLETASVRFASWQSILPIVSGASVVAQDSDKTNCPRHFPCRLGTFFSRNHDQGDVLDVLIKTRSTSSLEAFLFPFAHGLFLLSLLESVFPWRGVES